MSGSRTSARARATAWRWPAGQGHAPLADLRPEPGRVGTDELRHARQRGRPQDHLVVDGGIAERDVIPDRAVKEHHVLRQETDPAPEIRFGQAA